jgi:hypothetical protein
VWPVVHELSFYVSAKKEKQQTIECEIQGIYKESFRALSNNSYREIAKRAQLNILLQNITLLI